MKNTARWRFACQCGEEIAITGLFLYKDGQIDFTGNCPACGFPTKVESSVDEILDSMGKVPDDSGADPDISFLKAFHICYPEEPDVA